MNKKPSIDDIDTYARETCDDPMIAAIWPFWVRLSRAQWTVRDGESILARLSIKPWESTDPEISRAWAELTQPEHLELLEHWCGQGAMNPKAQEYTKMAIEEAKRRRQS